MFRWDTLHPVPRDEFHACIPYGGWKPHKVRTGLSGVEVGVEVYLRSSWSTSVFLRLLPSASSLIQMMRDALNTKMGYKWKWKTIPTFKDLTKSVPHPSLFPALCLSLSLSPLSKTRCTYYIKYILHKAPEPGSFFPFSWAFSTQHPQFPSTF